MIIVDTNPLQLLWQALPARREAAGVHGCLYWSAAPALNQWPEILSAVQANIDEPTITITTRNLAIYLSPSGEAWLLFSAPAGKSLRRFAALILQQTQAGTFFDLTTDYRTLLAELDTQLAAAARSAAADAHAAAAASLNLNRATIAQFEFDAQIFNSLSQERARRKQPSVLVLDDDAFTCRLINNVLRDSCQIHSAHDALSGLQLYAQHAPDLLLLDINLPAISGLDLINKITMADTAAHIVMLSGNADKTNVLQAVQRGAKGFIAKPFTREKILAALDGLKTNHKTP